jgi:glycerol-3-phosphate acyltransferase PlsY
VPGAAAGVAMIAASFLAGSIPWGYLAGRVTQGIDLRAVGSGGTGATNVLRTLGARASAIVFVLDLLKGFVPVQLAQALGFPPWVAAAAAVAAVAGHCWSPFIGFKGGKGVATGAGAAVSLFPLTLMTLPVLLVIVWRTRYVSLGSLVATLLTALLALTAAATGRLDWTAAIAIVVIAAIIVFRHEGNISRLREGTERRFGETVATSRAAKSSQSG